MTRSSILGWPLVRLVCVTGLILTHTTGCEDALLGEPAVEPEPPAPVELDCDALCGMCGDGDCRAVCLALGDALAPPHVDPWARCMAGDPCDADQARRCIDGLGCEHPGLIAEHCDVVARCAADGRGMLDEEHCRAHPYHEASRWGCLKPDRVEAVSACLSGGRCGELPACLDNAVCVGDPMCGTLLSTALTVDCHRVCERSFHECLHGGFAYGDCWRSCERAAQHLDDRHRRSFEACAFEAECTREARLDAQCLQGLVCELSEPLVRASAAASARCGADWDARLPIDDWSCLGNVHIEALTGCFGLDACDAIEPCLAQATTCVDDPDCLSFLEARQP